MMEDKRLNFNRPLISARRFSPVVANSQRKSTPVLLPCPSDKSLRNPGTVPFVWEQIPGTPKHETKTQKPPNVPSLPPGRILKPKKQDEFDIITKGFYVEKGPMFESSKDSKKENEKPQFTYGPNFVQFNDHDDDEDDSDFDNDEHVSMSFKFCGLLPHFCLKGSIGILNPTPGLSVRTGLPISSTADNTARVASSSAGSQDVVAYDQPKSSVKSPQKLEHSPSESSPAFVSEKEVNKKGLVSFKELLALEDEKEAIEKTVYVDKVKEKDVDILSEPFWLDKEMMTQIGDRKVGGSEFPAPPPPPLPKSPSDSWLWRTLPSANSKTATLWSNHKPSS